MANTFSIIVILLLCALQWYMFFGRFDNEKATYIDKYDCVYIGRTADRNGANTGGTYSIYKCSNGRFIIR